MKHMLHHDLNANTPGLFKGKIHLELKHLEPVAAWKYWGCRHTGVAGVGWALPDAQCPRGCFYLDHLWRSLGSCWSSLQPSLQHLSARTSRMLYRRKRHTGVRGRLPLLPTGSVPLLPHMLLIIPAPFSSGVCLLTLGYLREESWEDSSVLPSKCRTSHVGQ